MMKKTYIVPALEVIEYATEMLIATSTPEVGSGSGEWDADGSLSNKRQPIGGTWNSDNWNQVEE